MRLNRGTIVLLVGSIAVIALVLILSNPAIAPTTPTPTPSTQRVGTMFPDVTADTVIRFEVRNYQTGEHTVVTKDSQNFWTITDATNATTRLTDQANVTEKLGRLVAIKYVDRFSPEEVSNYNAATYGLDKPDYEISMTSSTGTEYTIFVGKKNPGGTRYYALVNVGPASTPLLPAESTAEATGEATSEATAESTVAPEGTPEVSAESTTEATAESTAAISAPVTSDQQVYLVAEFDITTLVALINTPPYEIPTATPTVLATPNPFSEVDQTATAAVEQTATAMFTPEVTVEATAEATSEATDEVTATSTP
jgi:hypothetical protein